VHVVADILIALVALIHCYIVVLEMFLWQKPRGLATFGTTAEFAKEAAALAANQGLYNGFLAAGLIWALIVRGAVGYQFAVFFLICVMVAGIYGSITVSRRILFTQTVPAAIALAATFIAH
jgi:putative membrane protein